MIDKIESIRRSLVQHGYVNEALVPKFFRGQEDGVFVSRFIKDERKVMRHGHQHLNNIALASAEMDREGLNVEMTDFATLQDFAGNGYALFLLHRMEQDMRQRGYLTSFTIARSESIGMNITFAKLSYTCAGTLVDNTNISGQIESMNVWYKHLSR